jgi:hypothetical protein
MTFTAVGRNWLPVLGFAVGISLVLAVVNVLSMQSVLTAIDPARPQAVFAIFQSATYWTALAVGFLGSSFAQAGLITGLLAGNREEPVSAGDMISGALRNVLPVFGLTFLWILAIMVGWLLVLVPALIMITMWSVALPALIAERTGILDAFGRSRALTKGYRWPVFGTLVIFGIIYWVIAFAVQGFSAGGALMMYKSNITAAVAIGVVSTTLMTVLTSSLLVALYRELIGVKEGGDNVELAGIFA